MKQKNLRVMIDEDVWRALRKDAAVKGIVFSFYVRQVLAAATVDTRKQEALRRSIAKKQEVA